MAHKFIKKNGKYYRINSDNTQTEVELRDDGYFHWRQPDKVRVKVKLDNNLTDMDYAEEQHGSNTLRFLSNLGKNTSAAITDGILYLANKAGLPANASHYLRDLNTALPYKGRAFIEGAIRSMGNDKTFNQNYTEALSDPGILNRTLSIEPLVSDNTAFTEEELELIKKAAGNRSRITAKDIKRVSEDNRYGSTQTPLTGYFSPAKVIQSSIGQSGGKNNILVDPYDFNTESSEAKSDNLLYWNKMLEEPGFNYATLRGIAPIVNSTETMPDKYKIKTVINLDE